MPLEDGLPDIPLEGGTVITSHAHATKTVPSSSAKLPLPQQQYTSPIDDSKLVTVTSSISSTPSTTTTTSSPVYSPMSSPRSPSSSSMDGISILHHKRSRGSISSHSGSGSDTDDDERAIKRHQSDSDVDSVVSDETRTHEPIVTIKYGEHAIRVLSIEDGTRVVVAKDFLLLTGISKENCARTTKNLIEGKDKRMMHVPSSYCMNKGQQAVVLTASGLSQLLVTSRRLKQSAALQAWIKQTLMPALQGTATTATNTNTTATEYVHMQSQSQANNKTNTNTNTNTKSKNGRTIVKAKRSVGKSPSASPVVKAAPAPLALSPTTSSFSPFIRSPSSSSSSASSPIRPTFSRLSSSDSELTMSDASTSSSTPSSPASSSSGMQELSAAADMMLITPNPMPLAKPLPMHFPIMPLMPTFSRMHPTFPYRTPLMPLPTMAGIGMGIRPTFTAGKIWAAGA